MARTTTLTLLLDHPMDEVTRPRHAAKRRSGSRSLSATFTRDEDTSEPSMPSSAKATDDEESSSSEDEEIIARAPDLRATRHSTRGEANKAVNYSRKFHPQDHALPGHQHKARLLAQSQVRTKRRGRKHDSSAFPEETEPVEPEAAFVVDPEDEIEQDDGPMQQHEPPGSQFRSIYQDQREETLSDMSQHGIDEVADNLAGASPEPYVGTHSRPSTAAQSRPAPRVGSPLVDDLSVADNMFTTEASGGLSQHTEQAAYPTTFYRYYVAEPDAIREQVGLDGTQEDLGHAKFPTPVTTAEGNRSFASTAGQPELQQQPYRPSSTGVRRNGAPPISMRSNGQTVVPTPQSALLRRSNMEIPAFLSSEGGNSEESDADEGYADGDDAGEDGFEDDTAKKYQGNEHDSGANGDAEQDDDVQIDVQKIFEQVASGDETASAPSSPSKHVDPI